MATPKNVNPLFCAAVAAAVLLMAVTAHAAGGCNICPEPSSGIPFHKPPVWTWPSGCPPVGRYNPLTGSCPRWSIPVGACCGTDGYPPCPALSCSYSFAYSSSGPGQCAQAFSTIQAATISNTTLVAMSDYVGQSITDFCLIDPPTYQQVTTTASAMASAMADAVATSLIYHSQFVCVNKFQGGNSCATCPTCKGGSAKTVVSGAVQAVANAAALSWAEAFASISSELANFPGGPRLLAEADAQSDAIANAINTAVLGYYGELSQGTPRIPSAGACKTQLPATEVKKAVAQALTCTFVKVLASVYVDPADGGIITPDSTSCSNSYSVSYSVGSIPVSLTCPDISCPL